MSIRPVDSFLAAGLSPLKTETGQRLRSFQTALDAAAEKGAVVADDQQTARKAEILRLTMMKSALSLDGTAALAPFESGRMEALIASYADRSENKDAGANGAAVGSSSGVATVITGGGAPAPTAAAGAEPSVAAVISRASRRYGVEESLIKAVIKAESNFKPTAVSSAGAKGMMQLMPATADSLGVKDPFNPEQNIMAGTRFLKDMLNRYGGDLDKALAAYNWGPGNLDRGRGRLPQETREYLVKVKRFYADYSPA